ncbi:DNA mismatch repair endonuclease MutL [Serpentinicella alkaliphila]|nr:DNA mismatch repair endonuclease MutL [Serpentinicella alkaliphila]
MNFIHVLDDNVINQIAAGEVVEGPYSVVKELIENAIDAKADSIVVEIKEGGKKFIRISDNGIGINEHEVEQAFMRHTTSKITKINDLDTLITLGFRGEALASIASVSQVEIITKTKDQQHGILLEITGGRIVNRKVVGCPTGTTIIIKNLFFNTPARFKFMKSTQVETSKISEIISRLAISKTDIAFKYINNNNIMFTTSGKGIVRDAIINVFGKEIAKNLIEVDESNKEYEIKGYISQPEHTRGNRNYEIIFVNNRFVKSKIIFSAIEDAYKGSVVINRFPICFLYLNINPSLIDINVHPAKTEIKVFDEQAIYDFIYDAIKKSLTKESTVSDFKINLKDYVKDNSNDYLSDKKTNSTMTNIFPKTELKPITVDKTVETNGFGRSNDIIAQETNDIDEIKNFFNLVKNQESVVEKEEAITQNSFIYDVLQDYKIIGQIFNTYIMIEKENSIYLIDQHAAHERLIYNELREQFESRRVVSQQLLTPEVLEFSNEESIIIDKYLEKFKVLGFDIEGFGQNSYIIRAIPIVMDQIKNFKFIYDLIDTIDINKTNDGIFEETLIKKSCKAAIKAMDKLSTIEIQKLISDLSKLEPPLTCPHGRPVLLTLSKYDIEKNFKRVQ